MKRLLLALAAVSVTGGALVTAQAPSPFKLGTFQRDNRTFVGIVRETSVIDLAAADAAIPGRTVAPPTDMKDVIARMLPYWESDIIPDLKTGKTVLVAAHGNSLRALVKHLDGISDDDIAELNIPTGIPLVYELGEDFMPTKPGEYLDPEASAAGAAAVAAQGRK